MTATLAGTAALTRFNGRRDRRLIGGCAAVLLLVVLSSSSSLRDLYPTVAERAKLAATLGDNPALIALRGPARGLETMGGLIAFQLAANGATAVALMSLLLAGRYTRSSSVRV